MWPIPPVWLVSLEILTKLLIQQTDKQDGILNQHELNVYRNGDYLLEATARGPRQVFSASWHETKETKTPWLAVKEEEDEALALNWAQSQLLAVSVCVFTCGYLCLIPQTAVIVSSLATPRNRCIHPGMWRSQVHRSPLPPKPAVDDIRKGWCLFSIT